MQLRPIGRFEWERLVRRIVMPKEDKFLALMMATWADLDGTRVRPGTRWLMNATGDSERTVRRHITLLTKQWGLIELVSRGGGRGGQGRASEWRLTIPVDLLERHTLLGPDGGPDDRPDSPATCVTAQWEVSPATQVTGDCGQPLSTIVDNSDSPATQMAGESPVDNSIDRPSGVTSERLTGHPASIDRPPRWPTTTYDQTTKETTTGSPPNATTDRAHDVVDNSIPPQRPTLDELLPLARPPKPSPGPKCTHGLDAGRHDDGRPRCPLCRRDAVLASLPHLAADPVGASP